MATYNTNKGGFARNGGMFEVVMIADENGQVGAGATSQGALPVTALPTGVGHINKFGYTGADVNGTATIWDGNGTTASKVM